MLFWKDTHFKYQREIRFALLNKFLSKDDMFFKIPTIKEQCVVMDTDKFLSDRFAFSIKK
jgi:hypothetical protein